MTADIRHAAGSLLVVGLSGTELSGLERAWLKLIRPAGIILFRRNIVDAAQTRALLKDATTHCADANLRCVDVEGGTVDRLRHAMAPMPSARAVFQAARQSGSAKLIQQQGALIAASVEAFGFNTTLAPVLDLALSESEKVMGTRVVSDSPFEVAEYGLNFLIGLRAHGVMGCGKHFPGLGAGTLDSHLATPSIHRTLAQLEQEDLIPYQELCNQLPMIMVNHAAYPNTRSGNLPASISDYWMNTILRKRLNYRGIIFSDDLEMGGILKFVSMEEAVIAAVRAGMDIVEICHSPELILRAYESLLSQADRSQTFRSLLLARARQTSLKRRKLFSSKLPSAPSQRQLQALRTRIHRFSEVVSRLEVKPL
jgi:beta-N-acetylhexosaminidase